jgi:hypothetical protein
MILNIDSLAGFNENWGEFNNMLNFKCSSCRNEIHLDFQYIGEMVQCPCCTALQIVPDPKLPGGAEYNGFLIVKTLSTSVLCTTYEVSGQPHNLALCVPTSFFLKRVSDIEGFAERVAITGSLNRPELPALLQHSAEAGNTYFIFEYQQNAFKLNRFINEKPLDFNSALLLVRKIATCLSEVWDQYGVLHQSINPENISITNELNVRIHNIGLSEYLLNDHQLLELGFNIWDYRYISPEFMNEGSADTPACDIYSLGALLFYLCTGHHPYENTLPASIPSAPIPLLSEYLSEAPESLMVLIRMMMAQNVESRLSSWQEVIRHIDTIIANQTAVNDVFYFNCQPSVTDYYEPVGLSAGSLTQAIKRDQVMSKSGTEIPIQQQAVKPIQKHNLLTMNKKWTVKKPAGSTAVGASRTAVRKKQTAPARKNSNVPFIVTISVAATVALVAVVFIIINANKKPLPPKRRAAAADSTMISNPQEAYAKQLELMRKHGFVPESAAPPQPKPESAAIPPKPKIDPPAPRHQIAQESDETKINNIIAGLKKQILPLLQSEKYDDAIAILLEYNGQLAPETRKKRRELADEIRARITKLQTEAKEVNEPAEAAPAPATAELADNPAEILKKVIEQFAPSLFGNKIADVKTKLEMAQTTASPGIIKDTLSNWLLQINNYERLSPSLKQARSADIIISAPENQQIMENAFLLRGMLFKDKEQFVQAKEAFMKIQLNTGHLFVEEMERSLRE